ncbi:sulfotransferase family protein [Lacinutrix iliipiscaria]|uniref:Sulfotransferase family protein n=1 Tax=Lacinutrix iliipiscaria TaxID=1230532 RepID=A0ABW5WQX2_9FLAO
MANIKRICLWSGPRNISTTLMYAFAQRQDTKVFDEPLYAYYLSNTSAIAYHPGTQDILNSLEHDGKKVIAKMMSNQEKPVLFFKNMTHHLLDLNRDFMKEVYNVILTRDPVEMLPSFDKVIQNPSIEDVGYANHTELLNYFETHQIQPIVLDSKRVLLNPKKVLTELCEFIGIPFNDNMLHWEAGPRVEDGTWAKFWYANIHKSTGFLEYKPKTEPFPKHLKPLLNECLPHYNKLLKYAIG